MFRQVVTENTNFKLQRNRSDRTAGRTIERLLEENYNVNVTKVSPSSYCLMAHLQVRKKNLI